MTTMSEPHGKMSGRRRPYMYVCTITIYQEYHIFELALGNTLNWDHPDSSNDLLLTQPYRQHL